MRLTWEKIKRSLGIPDKLTDAEMADEIPGREAEKLAHEAGLASGIESGSDADRGAHGANGPIAQRNAGDTEAGQGGDLGLADADAQRSPEFTGRDQPQIESGPWGSLADQDGPRQYAGIPEAVLENQTYSQRQAAAGDMEIGESGEIGGDSRFAGDGERTSAERGSGTDMGEWQQHGDDGVHVTPTPITLGETVHVRYTGRLAASNPPSVQLHWGFGPGHWTDVQDVTMERDGDAYTATLNVAKNGRFEFCFHDNEGNWDNNDGRNWSYIIHDGELPGKYVEN